MAHSIIALGSNLGDRESYLDFAKKEIAKECRLECSSSYFQTKPVGYLEQGDFLNAAILVDTTFEPLELLAFLQSIENAAKRERPFKNAPRTLDLDIIFYEGVNMDSDMLKLPHPLWQDRAFVVEPILELIKIAPQALEKFGLERNRLCEILEGINE